MGKFIHETDITGYNILSNEDLDALHEATLQLMEDYGLQMHGKEALDILAGAGCEVDYENDRVKFPRNLVNDAIEKVPGRIYPLRKNAGQGHFDWRQESCIQEFRYRRIHL